MNEPPAHRECPRQSKLSGCNPLRMEHEEQMLQDGGSSQSLRLRMVRRLRYSERESRSLSGMYLSPSERKWMC